MRNLYAVQFLLERTNAEEPFGIIWALSPAGGYEAEVNGIGVRIMGSEESVVFLTLSKGAESHLIHEQNRVHLSESRLGKALNALFHRVGLGEAIKPPADPKAQAESELNKALNELLVKIHKQYFARCRENYRDKVRDEIIHQLTGI